METVCEPDGLALSSRNVHLGSDDRQRALVLSRALRARQAAAASGPAAVLDAVQAVYVAEPTINNVAIELGGSR